MADAVFKWRHFATELIVLSVRWYAAVPAVQIDTDRCRVVEWQFAPGGATGWHTSTRMTTSSCR